MPDSIPVLLLFGPTASGKTDVLESLFATSTPPFPAEIISADSMQVYRGMDIGTAKPGMDLRSRLPHHLIDIRNPNEQFSVGDFVRLADEACLDISSRGVLPVVSGGTGFYLKNFVLGLPEAPPSDRLIREELRVELAERGAAELLAELFVVDPVSAARIHRNDEYRLLRALEVFRAAGRPLSSFPVSGAAPSVSSSSRPSYRFLTLSIERDRDELYNRINARTHDMFRSGLPEEVSALVEAGYGPADPGLRAIGYREFFLEDGSLAQNLEAVEELVARNSRRYAKRQIVFFSSIPNVVRLRVSSDSSPLSSIVEKDLGAFLRGA